MPYYKKDIPVTPPNPLRDLIGEHLNQLRSLRDRSYRIPEREAILGHGEGSAMRVWGNAHAHPDTLPQQAETILSWRERHLPNTSLTDRIRQALGGTSPESATESRQPHSRR